MTQVKSIFKSEKRKKNNVFFCWLFNLTLRWSRTSGKNNHSTFFPRSNQWRHTCLCKINILSTIRHQLHRLNIDLNFLLTTAPQKTCYADMHYVFTIKYRLNIICRWKRIDMIIFFLYHLLVDPTNSATTWLILLRAKRGERLRALRIKPPRTWQKAVHDDLKDDAGRPYSSSIRNMFLNE